jgi:hypothetical protein
MHDPAQKHAVEAGIRKRQVLDIAFEKLDAGMLAATDRDQFGADVEPDTRAPGCSPVSRTNASTRRALASGVNTS